MQIYIMEKNVKYNIAKSSAIMIPGRTTILRA